MQQKKIAIIVVLYQAQLPESYLFHSSEKSIFIFVDNTPDRDLNINDRGLIYIPLKRNKGIAVAQNIGIRRAVNEGCEFVLFFDQDSNIPKNYIEDISEEYQRISKFQKNLFLLGPRVFNERENKEYKSVFHSYSSKREFEVRPMIISSGSYTSLARVKEVGYLDESLFIDMVDYEWCWRAQAKGFVSGVTNHVVLQHNVGQRWLKIGNYIVIISAPFRYYYQYRNYLWLCRRDYVPREWKRNVGIKLFLRLFYFPFCVKDGWNIVKYAYKGIWSGLKKEKNNDRSNNCFI